MVTDSEGRQSVQEVKNDIGIKGDPEAIIKRLAAQGIDVKTINLNGKGSMDDAYENENNIEIIRNEDEEERVTNKNSLRNFQSNNRQTQKVTGNTRVPLANMAVKDSDNVKQHSIRNYIQSAGNSMMNMGRSNRK